MQQRQLGYPGCAAHTRAFSNGFRMGVDEMTLSHLPDELFRLVVEAAPTGMIVIDRTGRMIFVNAHVEKLFGYRREELLGQPEEFLVPPRFRGPIPQNRANYFENPEIRSKGSGRELVGLRKDGSEFPVEIELTPLRTVAGSFVLANIIDISERNRTEGEVRRVHDELEARVQERTAELHAGKERLDVALATAGVGAWEWKIGENTVNWTEHMDRLHGFQPGTLPGTYEGFLQLLDPNDRERVAHEVYRAIFEGAVYDTEFRIVWPDGTRHALAARGHVFRDETGRPLRMMGVCWDVTARLRAQEDLQRLAKELARSNAELEQFAYIASHDLQEPLRKVQAFGDLLAMTAVEALDEQGRFYVERMRGAAGRMQMLVNDLLNFARVTSLARPFVEVDLAGVANEVASDLENRLKITGGQVEIGELPRVESDPSQMRQLLQNLIGNALKFHRKGVPPVVVLRSRFLGDSDPALAEPARTAGRCEISVQDNGIGFEEKYLERIFAPFQRLHARAEYEGTGMGLAICRKIVERHGGSITARSTPGQGTTFLVTLPLRQAKGELRDA